MRQSLISSLFISSFLVVFAFPSTLNAQEFPNSQSRESINGGPIGAHGLTAQTGPNPGQVTLHWSHAFGDVQNYNLSFGTEPGKFQYGAIGIGKVTSYTVNYLSPSQKYYFAISPVRNGKAQYMSFQVAAVSKAGVVTPPSSQPNQTISNPVPGDDSYKSQLVSQIKSKGVGKHQLSVVRGKNSSEVVLKWNNAISGVQNYHIVYGTEPGKFQYGALNVGKVNEFKIDHLKPGQHYYFAIVPVKDGTAQYITEEVTTSAPSSPSSSSGGQSGQSNSSSSGGNSETKNNSGGGGTSSTGAGDGSSVTTSNGTSGSSSSSTGGNSSDTKNNNTKNDDKGNSNKDKNK